MFEGGASTYGGRVSLHIIEKGRPLVALFFKELIGTW
jgi:hypothetical protein